MVKKPAPQRASGSVKIPHICPQHTVITVWSFICVGSLGLENLIKFVKIFKLSPKTLL